MYKRSKHESDSLENQSSKKNTSDSLLYHNDSHFKEIEANEDVFQDDVVNVPPNVPVVDAKPVLEQQVLDVPPVLLLVNLMMQRFSKAFATNVDLSVLDEMTIQTEDGFSMTLEMWEEIAHGRIRYALRGWQNFMLQASLVDGVSSCFILIRILTGCSFLTPNV
ncbi:hypothetical protein Hanom_Chr09g00766911 [Helianthus anomalus]